MHALSLASPHLAHHTACPCSPAAGSTNGDAAAVVFGWCSLTSFLVTSTSCSGGAATFLHEQLTAVLLRPAGVLLDYGGGGGDDGVED